MAAPAYLLKVLGLHSCLPSWENWDNSPHKPSKFYDGLLVSNHIQGVVLDTDNIQLVTLLQGGAVGGHQHHVYGDEGGGVQDVRWEDRHGVGVAQSIGGRSF